MPPRKAPLFLAGMLLTSGIPVLTAAPARLPAQTLTTYEGPYRAAFDQAMDRVRILVRQTPLEVSMGAGLYEYREGFRYPLRIRFEDRGPMGLENALAYVRLGRMGDAFAQELVIVLEPMAHPETLPAWAGFDAVFTHEMTHAVLNDAVGGEASMKLPRWLQEGLAQWISMEGEPRLKETGARYRKLQIRQTPMSLTAPPAVLAYPLYYLAVRYLHEKHSINAVQGLVRSLIEGRPIEEAVFENTQLSYAEFLGKVEKYSREILLDLARSDFAVDGAGL